MKKKIFFGILGITILLASFIALSHFTKKDDVSKTNKLNVFVLSKSSSRVVVQDSNNLIYTFKNNDLDFDVGSQIVISYTGVLSNTSSLQKASIVSFSTVPVSEDYESIPEYSSDNGIFSQFYKLAKQKIDTLSLDDKIAQLLLVRYPGDNYIDELSKYNFGGFVFYENDFKDKSENDVKNMINNLQKRARIPYLTAVDEEGGKVVRASSNPKLISSKFKSSKELYNSGGLSAIKEDTINKSDFLNNLGINLNLAPVVDVTTNSSDYMYVRALGENTAATAEYAKTVIEASKKTHVSYTLKHFPGYGNNTDTHYNSSVDNRTYESIVRNDLPPFEAGIDALAENILVSHNIVKSMAATTFVGQNYGAGRLDRVKRSVWVTLAIGVIYTLCTGAALLAGQDAILHLFTADEAVVTYGKLAMRWFCPFYFLLSILHGLAGAVRGTGASIPPMVVLLVSLCLFRVVWIQFLLPFFSGIEGVFILYPVSWGLGALLMILYAWKGKWLEYHT